MPEFGTRQVEYHRDTAGTLFAVELIEAATWRSEFLEPPSVAAADARIVRLRGATAPKQRPPGCWSKRQPAAAQIEELLGGISPGPLTQLLAQYDEVVAETLDDVVVAFRIILEEALEGGGAVKMR